MDETGLFKGNAALIKVRILLETYVQISHAEISEFFNHYNCLFKR